MKATTWSWAGLLVLTACSFAVSESAPARSAASFILSMAGLKATLVAWQFMELRCAHRAWQVAFFGLLGGVLGLVWWLA